MLIQTILALLGLTSLWVGLSGVLRAHSGMGDAQNSPLKYPAPVPWLQRRETSTREVYRIGQLYSVAGLFLCAGGLLHEQPDHPPEQSRVCEDIVDVIQQNSQPRRPSPEKPASANPNQCSTLLIDPDGHELFRIESQNLRDPIGEAFHTTIRELTRMGMSIEPVNGIGMRAAIATPGAAAGHKPTLVFEDERGLHQIKMLSSGADIAQLTQQLKQQR